MCRGSTELLLKIQLSLHSGPVSLFGRGFWVKKSFCRSILHNKHIAKAASWTPQWFSCINGGLKLTLSSVGWENFPQSFWTQVEKAKDACLSDTVCRACVVSKQLYVVTTGSPDLTLCCFLFFIPLHADVSLYLIVHVCTLCFHCCSTHVPPPSLQPVGGVY